MRNTVSIDSSLKTKLPVQRRDSNRCWSSSPSQYLSSSVHPGRRE